MAVRVAEVGRGMVGAFRAGWAIETNWTNPFAYLLFLLLRPVGGALILVVIYRVAVGGPLDTAAVGFLAVGAALWSFVIAILHGISWTIIQEREWLKVLKYIAAAPLPLPLYVISRSAVRIITGAIGAVVVLAIATLGFGIDVPLGSVDWPLLAVTMPIGLVALEAIGLALAGVTMSIARHPFGISEGVAGILYLVSGAVFPPSLLPDWLEPVSDVLPLTYWLEAARRALLPDYDPALLGIADPLLPLVVTTAATVVVGSIVFYFFDRRTRLMGRYDETTEY